MNCRTAISVYRQRRAEDHSIDRRAWIQLPVGEALTASLARNVAHRSPVPLANPISRGHESSRCQRSELSRSTSLLLPAFVNPFLPVHELLARGVPPKNFRMKSKGRSPHRMQRSGRQVSSHEYRTPHSLQAGFNTALSCAFGLTFHLMIHDFPSALFCGRNGRFASCLVTFLPCNPMRLFSKRVTH